MEVVVTDTNILIDLFEADLLKFCKLMSLDFHTLDVVIEEVENDSQRKAINVLIADGTLKVKSLSGRQMVTVMDKVEEYAGVCNLSPEDISVMVYAKENNYRLLTGDKTLRTKAIQENVTVSGVLFLTDNMVADVVVEPLIMANALEQMILANKRLPHTLIRERIAELRGEG